MALTLLTKPTVYPVTIDAAKQHLNVEHNDDDTLIESMVAMATEYAETYTGLDLVQRTWSYSIDEFPVDHLTLPKAPVVSVSGVTYTDVTTSPESNTVSTTVYGLESSSDRAAFLYLKYGQYWPQHTRMHNGITIQFVSGFDSFGSPADLRGNVPDAVKFAILMMVGDAYNNREAKSDIALYKNDAAYSLLNSVRAYR